jgi:hypothetical protein
MEVGAHKFFRLFKRYQSGLKRFEMLKRLFARHAAPQSFAGGGAKG